MTKAHHTLIALALGLSMPWCDVTPASAEDAASLPLACDTVHYTSGADTVRAVLFQRPGDSSAPGVVVIHEWWGMDDWIVESGRRIADHGYAVLVLDLYRGHVAATSDEAHELMRGLPEDRAARDLLSAVAYLRAQPGVNSKRVGTIGWCMGGGYSLQAALTVPDLKASVICYGRLVADDSTLAPLTAEVFGIFGAEDRGIPAASVADFEARATRLGKRVNMEVYDGVGHAFMNSGNEKYSKEAAQQAWTQIFEFLDRTLKPSGK